MLLPLVVFVVLLMFIVSTQQAALQVKRAANHAVEKYIDVATKLPHTRPLDWTRWLSDVGQQLGGWQFLVVQDNQIVARTITLESRQEMILSSLPAAPSDIAGYDEMLVAAGNEWYYLIPIEVPGWPRGSYLVCLEPYQSIATTITGAFSRSAWQAFVVSGLLILGAAVYSHHLSRRVIRIQQQVKQIADGDLTRSADDRGGDEISQLARSVNRMAADLDSMKRLVRTSERAKLHTQVAEGVAHELRNGIHAARLSIEMFRDVCRRRGIALPDNNLLATSHDQLTMTETLVRRLLTLGKPQNRTMIARPLPEVVADAVAMIEPICRHAEIRFEVETSDTTGPTIADSDAIHAALVNLCMNAIEAAGRHGAVRLVTVSTADGMTIEIRDTGSGPHPDVATTLFEPFVTTKAEGIGMGLVLVRQAATDAGGSVTWRREAGETVFAMNLPAIVPKSSDSCSVPAPAPLVSASL